MPMGIEAQVRREITDEFSRLQSSGKIPKGVQLLVRIESSNDPDCELQGVAYNKATKHRIMAINPKPFQLRQQLWQEVP